MRPVGLFRQCRVTRNVSTSATSVIHRHRQLVVRRTPQCSSQMRSYAKVLEAKPKTYTNVKPVVVRSDAEVKDPTPFNKQLNALAAKDDEEGSAAMFNQMLQQGAIPNAETYTILLEMYFRLDQDKVEFLLRSSTPQAAKKPSAFAYNSMVSALAQLQQFDSAVRVKQVLEREGYALDAFTYNTFVSSYSAAFQLEKAAKLLAEMEKKNVPADEIAYNDFLKGTLQSQGIDQAKGVVEAMKKRGFKPYAESNQIMISSLFKDGKNDEALSFFKSLSKQYLNPECYLTMIHVYGALGMVKEAQEGFVILKKNGYKPMRNVFNAIISVYCTNNLLPSAESLLTKMEAEGVKPTEDTYIPMLKHLLRNNKTTEGLRLAKKIIGLGLQFSEDSYNTLIIALSQGKYNDGGGAIYSEMKNHNVTLNHDSLLATMAFLTRSGQGSDAYDLYKKYRKTMDFVLEDYEKFLSIFNGRATDSMYILEDMKANNIVPSNDSLHTLISALAKTTRINEVLGLLEYMASVDRDIDISVLNNVAQVYINKEALDEVFPFFESKYNTKQLKPDTSTYNKLLSYYNHKMMFDEGAKLMAEMRKKQIPANPHTRKLFDKIESKSKYVSSSSVSADNMWE